MKHSRSPCISAEISFSWKSYKSLISWKKSNLFPLFPFQSGSLAALPEAAVSTISRYEIKPSPSGRRCPSGRMRGFGKHSLQPYTCRLLRSTSHTWRVFNILSMDSAITPKASRRMTETTFQMRGVFFKAIHTFFRCLSNWVLSQWLYCNHQKIDFCPSVRMASLSKITVSTTSPCEKKPS